MINDIKKEKWVFCYWDEPVKLKSNKNNNAKSKDYPSGEKSSNKSKRAI